MSESLISRSVLVLVIVGGLAAAAWPVAGQRIASPPAGPTADAPLTGGTLVGLQATPRFGRTGTGLGAGATVAALALAAVLTSGDGNACTGSGDYLRVCRVFFVGGTVLGGGVGTVVGNMLRRTTPSGRARPVLLGSALGALVPFMVSLATCSQGAGDNPELVCGPHGMVQPGTTAAAAAAGGLIGYVLGGRSARLELRGLGPQVLPGGRGTAVSIAASARVR